MSYKIVLRDIFWTLAAVALGALWRCGGTDGPRGVVRIGVRGCIAPQTDYLAAHVADPEGYGTDRVRLAAADEAPDIVVACVAFPDGEPAVAGLDLGTGEVRIDPARVPGELAFAAVYLHEWTHWRIGRGPHPDRARVHVCRWADEAPPGECWTGWWDATAVMRPTTPGTGGTAAGWSGDVESVDVGAIPNFALTEADRRMFAWATAP